MVQQPQSTWHKIQKAPWDKGLPDHSLAYLFVSIPRSCPEMIQFSFMSDTKGQAIFGNVDKIMQHFVFVADFSKRCAVACHSASENWHMWNIPEDGLEKKAACLTFYCIFELFMATGLT